MNIIDHLFNVIKNKTLNAVGIERDIIQLIQDRDVSRVKSLLQDRDSIVEEALREYFPKGHKIMERQDKYRKDKEPYITNKLPRSRQRYINEVELFFLLGNPIKWTLINTEGHEEAFNAFKQFLRETRFDTTMRQAKRLAGAETECAKLYHLYKDENNTPHVKVVVLARSKGHYLRPLFDQYGNMRIFGHGYYLKEHNKTVEHFDIYTASTIYECKKNKLGWEINASHNPSGKTNIIYYSQEKAWDGVQSRIEREEEIDSKIGDTNNYFADPIAAATADVVTSLADPDVPGRVVTLNGTNSKFEYINPPIASELQAAEKRDLNTSILFDSFTPEFMPEKMVGLGTLSGDAIRRAMVLGYIKRDNRKEIYDELIDREKNLILSIMMNVTHIELRDQLKDIQIKHEFAEPFAEDVAAHWQSIAQLYNSGVISLQTAVKRLGITDNSQEEVTRILKAETMRNMNDALEPTF